MSLISIIRSGLAGLALATFGVLPAMAQEVTLRVGIASKLSHDLQLDLAGQLKDLPFKVEFSYFDAAPVAFEALASGHIDLFSGGETPVFGLAVRPENGVVVAATRDALFDGILVPQDSDIKSVSDLKGKRVALFKGSGSHIMLINTLRENGLDWSDIEPAYLSLADALAAFQNGNIDAWDSWDPSAAITQVEHGGRVIAAHKDVFAFFYASREAVADEGKSNALVDYIARVYKSTDWVRKHPEEWTAKQIEIAGLNPEAAALATSRVGVFYQPVTDELIKQIQADADIFAEIGILPTKVDVSAVFDGRFNDKLEAALQGVPRSRD